MKQSKNNILNIVSLNMNKKPIKQDIIEWPQNLNTYLGNKGYTILKSELSIKHQLTLKEMLMVKPFVPGSPVQLQKHFLLIVNPIRKYMSHDILVKMFLDQLKLLKLLKVMILT